MLGSEPGHCHQVRTEILSGKHNAKTLARAHNARGVAYAKKRDYDRAIADYTRAVRLDPQDGYGFFHRGEAFHDTGDYGRAITDLSQAIALKVEADAAKVSEAALPGRAATDPSKGLFSQFMNAMLLGYLPDAHRAPGQ
jgi:tetratricopeptide (TPR) repeat protein